MAFPESYRGYAINEGLTGGRWSNGTLVDQSTGYIVVHPDGTVDKIVYESAARAKQVIDSYIDPPDEGDDYRY